MKMRRANFVTASLMSLALLGGGVARAETATNTINGGTTSLSGDYYVGNTGPNNGLIVTNAGVLNIDGTGFMGNAAGSSNNFVLVTGNGSAWNNNNNLYVGCSGGANRLTIQNGGLASNTSTAYVGYNASAGNNTVLVTGSNSLWENDSDFIFGTGSVGNQLIITNGGAVAVAGTAYLGYNAGANNNSVLVTGSGSAWNNYKLYVGYSGGANQLTIQNGGMVSNTGAAYVGYNASASNNTVLVTGSNSLWKNGSELDFASAGNQLIITNGGRVQDQQSLIGYYASASNNTVLVTGSGSVWSNNGSLYVGYFSPGNSLTISNSGVVYNATGYLGYSAINNSVLVTGSGSVWSNNGSLYVGDFSSGNSLTITNNGAVVVAGNAYVGYNANATNNQIAIAGGNLDVTGGLYATNNTAVHSNSFNFNYGTLTTRAGAQIVLPTGSSINLGNTAGQTATWNMLGGTNSITLVSGSTDTHLGSVAGASANVLVTGPGTVWTNSGGLYVGSATGANNNQLTISNGAQVFNVKGDIGYDGASNTVLVTGNGSVWNNSDMLVVGDHTGGNSLTVTNSGQVANTAGYIGYAAAASNNTVTVTGPGSSWTNTGNLYVGNSGASNQLTVANGAQLASADSYIGYDTAANNNSVLLTGTGTVWNSSGQLVLGYNGGANNQLTIAAGAALTNASSASIRGNTNTVLVTDPGSRWDIGGQLTVGTYRGNKLIVTNGAVVTAAGTVWSGRNGGGGNSILVTGTNSILNAIGQEIRVGDADSNDRLTIANGGVVSAGLGNIGLSSGNNNTVLVSGTGSRWSLSGDLNVGYSANNNQLTITNSGGVTVGGNAVIGRTSSTGNQITVAGGSLIVTNAGATGTLDVRWGALALNGGTVTADRFLATNASSVVQFNAGLLRSGGTTVNNGNAFAVGDGAQPATLDLQGGTHSFADGLAVSSNATLTGTGTLLAPLTLGGGATLSPGHSPGRLTLNGNLQLANNSTYSAELAGYTAGVTYDQLIVGGLATNLGALLSISLLDGFMPTNGAQFVIMDNASSMVGTFSGAPEGSTNNFGSAEPFKITYAGGLDNHDVVLTAIPEPGAVALVFLLGGALVAWRRLRRWS